MQYIVPSSRLLVITTRVLIMLQITGENKRPRQRDIIVDESSPVFPCDYEEHCHWWRSIKSRIQKQCAFLAVSVMVARLSPGTNNGEYYSHSWQQLHSATASTTEALWQIDREISTRVRVQGPLTITIQRMYSMDMRYVNVSETQHTCETVSIKT